MSSEEEKGEQNKPQDDDELPSTGTEREIEWKHRVGRKKRASVEPEKKEKGDSNRRDLSITLRDEAPIFRHGSLKGASKKDEDKDENEERSEN